MQTDQASRASPRVEFGIQTQPLHPSPSVKSQLVALPLMAGSALYLYSQLFYSPAIPFLLRGDQVFFWFYAQRMLYGEKVYRDFFQFTPPGTDLFFAALFKLIGPTIWVTNLAVLLLGVVLCWLCFYLARQFMREYMAALAALLSLVLLYGSRLDATHHWFSLLALLCGIAVVLKERTARRIVIAGALMGFASFFTQTAGAAGIGALLFSLAWEHDSERVPWRAILKNQAVLLLAFGLTCAALYAPFIAGAGWKQFWFLVVTYPQHYVIHEHEFLFPLLPGLRGVHAVLSTLQDLFVYLLMIVIYPAVLWHCRRRRRDCMPLVLLAMTGMFLVLEIITRMNIIRIDAVAMPAIILLFCAVDRSEAARRYVPATWLIVICLAIAQTHSMYHERKVADLPAGKAALTAEDFEEFSWVQQHTQPGDFFFQATWLNLYPPLKLRSPVFVDGLLPAEVTRPEFVALTVKQVEASKVKYIFWVPRWEMAQREALQQDHLGPFREYVKVHYAPVHVFSNGDEILERR